MNFLHPFNCLKAFNSNFLGKIIHLNVIFYFSNIICGNDLWIAFKLSSNVKLLRCLNGIKYKIRIINADEFVKYKCIRFSSSKKSMKMKISKYELIIIQLCIKYHNNFKVYFDFLDKYFNNNNYSRNPIYLEEIISMELFLVFLNSITGFKFMKRERILNMTEFIAILDGITNSLNRDEIENLARIFRSLFTKEFCLHLLLRLFEKLSLQALSRKNYILLYTNGVEIRTHRKSNINYFESYHLSLDAHVMNSIMSGLNNQYLRNLFDLLFSINNINSLRLFRNYKCILKNYGSNISLLRILKDDQPRIIDCCNTMKQFFSFIDGSIYKNSLQSISIDIISTDSEICNDLNTFKRLKQLFIAYSRFEKHMPFAFIQIPKFLQEVRLHNMEITSENLKSVLNSNIGTLLFDNCIFSNIVFKERFKYSIFKKCKNFYVLDCQYDLSFLRLLWGFSCLEIISIVNAKYVSEMPVPNRRNTFLKKIKHLNIPNVEESLTSCFFKNLKFSRSLEYLNASVYLSLENDFCKLIESNIFNSIEEICIHSNEGNRFIFDRLLTLNQLKTLDLRFLSIPNKSLIELYRSKLIETIQTLKIGDYTFDIEEYDIFCKMPKLVNLVFYKVSFDSNFKLIFGLISPDRIIGSIHIEYCSLSEDDLRYISKLKISSLILIHTQKNLLQIYYNLIEGVIKDTLVMLKIYDETETDVTAVNLYLAKFVKLEIFIVNDQKYDLYTPR
ncbi:hypothetical protein CWI36_1299p0010 [Hamiltosporidium magnivora]|uniref:Uncharacterized protein n=1 Tax=Hamiltosporidium magnivora TaxID=148818 RepID=A0A4Q9L2G1_9MICR|nr:hypothetical protein CWI36_1299p0010 [Hamiltosporidium magnivora]